MGVKYCAFLRGVNVNGTTMKMEALKAAFVGMGFANARTVFASGNVLFDASEQNPDGRELKAYIEEGLGRAFHYDAHVYLRDGGQIADMWAAARTVPVPDGCHRYSLIFDDGELFAELKRLFDSLPHGPQEQLTAHGSGAFWIVPKGMTVESEFGAKVLGSRQYKDRLTSRNTNTIEKISRFLNG